MASKTTYYLYTRDLAGKEQWAPFAEVETTQTKAFNVARAHVRAYPKREVKVAWPDGWLIFNVNNVRLGKEHKPVPPPPPKVTVLKPIYRPDGAFVGRSWRENGRVFRAKAFVTVRQHEATGRTRSAAERALSAKLVRHFVQARQTVTIGRRKLIIGGKNEIRRPWNRRNALSRLSRV